MGPFTSFEDIPQFTRPGCYAADVPWGFVEQTLLGLDQGDGLDLDPDFQRGHVWDLNQRRRYVEFVLRGGSTGREVLFNNAGWNRSTGGVTVLVDGKQRLDAVRSFMTDGFPAFGTLYSGYRDRLSMTGPSFRFVVNNLATRAEVLQWYVDLNAGGTPHAPEEIERVRGLISGATGERA